MESDGPTLWGAARSRAASRRLYRGVHVPLDAEVDPAWQMRSALKRAGPGAVIGGLSAAILHGIAWFDDEFEVEVCRPATGQGRNRGGIKVVRADLDPGDVTTVEGIPVLSVVRTAYDLGRRPPEWRALGHLDDLLKVTGLNTSDLWAYIRAHPATRGVCQIRGLIPHIDTSSESPPESWLRLLIVRGELPKPETQISLYDQSGHEFARFDLGYRKYRIGVEYDGDEFHSTEQQRLRDKARDAKTASLGWVTVRVRAEQLRNDPQEVVSEIRKHLWDRGYRE